MDAMFLSSTFLSYPWFGLIWDVLYVLIIVIILSWLWHFLCVLAETEALKFTIWSRDWAHEQQYLISQCLYSLFNYLKGHQWFILWILIYPISVSVYIRLSQSVCTTCLIILFDFFWWLIHFLWLNNPF